MKILFVYGFEPSGHSSAAKALEDRARALGHETLRVNLSAHHPFMGPAVARFYLSLVQRFPGFWHFVYDNERVASLARGWRRAYLALAGGRMRRTLERLAPEVIVCTHAPPMAALALDKERGRLNCPLVGVITDLRAHAYWARRGADLYLLPNAEAAEQLRAGGVSEERLRVTGVPVHPTFSTPLAREEARARLGLHGKAPILLLSGGSRGLGRVGEMTARLLARLPEARLLVVAGSNEVLLATLRERYRRERHVLVYPELDSERVKELMCAADLLVGKAGGVTISEAVSVGLPMVFFEPLPGQETANARVLLDAGAALEARGLDELDARVTEALDPARAASMLHACRELARPRSAEDGVAALLALGRSPAG